MSGRTKEIIENEIQQIKDSNPNWITNESIINLISSLTNEKNLLQASFVNAGGGHAVTLSAETIEALATVIDSKARSAVNSFISTPTNAIIEETSLAVDGVAMVLRTRAKVDAKRYLKLFKKHGEFNNNHYKIKSTKQYVSIHLESGGLSETTNVFDYKAGVMKALYCLLVLKNYNLPNVLKHIKDNGFQPFSDAEYASTQATPEPQEALKNQYTLEEGKWL